MLNLAVIPNKPVISYKDLIELNIYGYSDRERELDLILKTENNYKTINIKLFSNKINKISLEIDNLCNKEICKIYLESNGQILDEVRYITRPEKDIERLVSFVWHNHQAPGKYPNNVYKYIWGIVHTTSTLLYPYGRGPYQYHTMILEKYPNYKSTFNLSPSLLEQWIELLENGINYRNSFISRDSLEARIVSETLEKYKKALERKQIDILTSVYAHTILGFLLEKDFENILRKEIEYGIEITKKVFRTDPKGFWTPEMAFNIRLVKIYNDYNLDYTILDYKCHLEKISNNLSHLEPYYLKYHNSKILVFFRDTELSNILSFNNNFLSELDSIKKAYDFSFLISKKLKNGGILTIALDGENWMIFSKNPPLTALFYDELIKNLVILQKERYLKTSNLFEISKEVDNLKTLENLPTTSWLCSWNKWCNERPEQKYYWETVTNLYWKFLEKKKFLDNKKIENIERAFWHALDSDYWWSDFWDSEMINSWLNYIRENINLV